MTVAAPGRPQPVISAVPSAAHIAAVVAPVLTAHRSARGSSLVPPDDLVRLAVGIETIDDLIGDLDRALDPR
jgi:cystathionine beta-lyase/cystathionine gamma-synthase